MGKKTNIGSVQSVASAPSAKRKLSNREPRKSKKSGPKPKNGAKKLKKACTKISVKASRPKTNQRKDNKRKKGSPKSEPQKGGNTMLEFSAKKCKRSPSRAKSLTRKMGKKN